MTQVQTAKFGLGQIVRHREQSFRGLIVDVDAVYTGPADQPTPDHRNQPFYRVLAMGEDSGFLVYAAEGVLEVDPDINPLSREDYASWFTTDGAGHLAPRKQPIQ
ncbi:MAG TPA: heat shock protein HspQ [Brevundimonas sp.]|jgi:heat shock protein HspQ